MVCPGADYANSINSVAYAKVGQQILPHDHYAFWATVPLQSDLLLGVKDEILAIDPPHELRAKFNSLFELLLRLALRDLSGFS